MENNIRHHTRGTPHPLLIAAAIAVILFCTVGIAAIMGWIPTSTGGNPDLARGADPAFATAAAPATVAPPVSDLPPSALVDQSAPLQMAQAPVAAPPMQRAYVPADQRAAPEPKVAERRRVAAAEPRSNWCSNCGNIESVRKVTTRARGTGVGAAGGAVLGGLLGNQVGGGTGRDIATVAGAVGGAVIGNQVEGNMKATTRYEVRVRLDDGSERTFTRDTAPPWRNGQRVRIVNGGIRAVD
ncbi:glycine zipper 2TM domain-containing protein [Pseudoduganella sp. GCM10020061]|uniref:glycine zipper 2TM domain-containing protein n=1 Tax=Pseudoduganella sp. GCM10020061 TaxID=3317345 RepID=UPI003638F27D